MKYVVRRVDQMMDSQFFRGRRSRKIISKTVKILRLLSWI